MAWKVRLIACSLGEFPQMEILKLDMSTPKGGIFWILISNPEFQVPTKGIQQILVWGYNNTAAQRQARPGVICDTPRYGRFLLPPSPRIEIAQHVRAIIPFSFSFPLSPPGADRGAFSQRLWPPFRISCNEGLLKNMVGECRNRQRRDWDYFTREKKRTRTMLCDITIRIYCD